MEIKYTTPEITPDTLSSYAYTNFSKIEGEIRAIALDFHGLGSCGMKKDDSDFDLEMAKHGILVIFPYYGPWSWMNSVAVKFVDRVVEVACEKYSLDLDKIRLLSTGGSMGGHSALIYTVYANRTPDACITNCPVCDFKFHATEREDLPRTVYLAFSGEGTDLETAIELHSAYHLAGKMPDIPYVVLHGTRDGAVNKEMHSDRFVARMRELGKRVEYMEIEGMEHCWLNPFPEAKRAYFDKFIELGTK